MGMLAWRRVQGPGAGGWCLELSWKGGRIIREQGWWGGNVCMLSVALPSNVRPCVCVPVSEAGDGEQWSEGDAVTRGEVVSARVRILRATLSY
jgi:hypothetical protein